MTIRKQEKISIYTHLLGAVAAFVGTIVLAVLTRDSANLFMISLVYGGSIMFLFSASTLYHANKKEENEVSVWRKFDHLAIFFMIAGTYTPICYIYLDGYWRPGIIIAQWSLVLFGFFFKFFYLKAPRVIYTVIYLLMGWMAIIAIGQLFSVMSTLGLFYLFAGAVSFTVGAVIYAFKNPDPVPGFFGFHEIFHVFILLGGLFHYIMVFNGMREALAM